MATGRDLLGDGFAGPPLKVWLWNGEDPLDDARPVLERASAREHACNASRAWLMASRGASPDSLDLDRHGDDVVCPL